MMKKMAVLSALFFMLSSATYADPIKVNAYSSIQNVKSIALDSTVQSQLQIVLAQDYSNFYNNFEEYAAPYKLKTANALYYEGRTRDSTAYSAATIYEDGRIFAATFDKNNNTLKYFTNDASCSKSLHPTIQVFLKQFNNPKIIYANANKNSILKFNVNQKTDCSSYVVAPSFKSGTQTQARVASVSDQEAAKTIATNIWGASVANSWDYNAEVGVVLSQAVQAISTCSANFSLVPKPPGYGAAPGLSYIGKYFTNIIAYITGVKQQPTYKTCIVTVAASYRSAMEMASLGI